MNRFEGSYQQGQPLMDQAPAMGPVLDKLARKAADAVADQIELAGNPSFPHAVRGSVTLPTGAHVSFESITEDHAVMHLHDLSRDVLPQKLAESGSGFFYGLGVDLSASEALRVAEDL